MVQALLGHGGGLSSFPVLLWGSQGAWAGRELAVSPGGSVIILLMVHLIILVCALVVKIYIKYNNYYMQWIGCWVRILDCMLSKILDCMLMDRLFK